MKILVIGGGGREHALVWKLARSPHATRMWCAPGNAGVAQERLASNGRAVECVDISLDGSNRDSNRDSCNSSLQQLLRFAQEVRADMTVVGPDNPLALGIVDLFEKAGLRIWGPNQKAAQFEGSKVFSQRFMERHGIPTARAAAFTGNHEWTQINTNNRSGTVEEARKFAASLDGRCAVKADGLALGKGVLICHGVTEANRAIDDMLLNRSFGTAGASIVIQELLEGTEISLHAICDGKTAKLFPTSQDHKRALDGDAGLNTGGMGACSPVPFLSEAEAQGIGRQILEPWLKGCAAEGITFKGILYPGVMLTKEGPKVLEFNARFGDPETQVYLTRLENDLVELLQASIDGALDRVELRWSTSASVCVVMASQGYPGPYAKGKVISGLKEVASLPRTKVFHAGTQRNDDQIVTSGGRVLGVTAWAESLKAARDAAYAAVEKIGFDGAQYRRDIGAKALGTGK